MNDAHVKYHRKHVFFSGQESDTQIKHSRKRCCSVTTCSRRALAMSIVRRIRPSKAKPSHGHWPSVLCVFRNPLTNQIESCILEFSLPSTVDSSSMEIYHELRPLLAHALM